MGKHIKRRVYTVSRKGVGGGRPPKSKKKKKNDSTEKAISANVKNEIEEDYSPADFKKLIHPNTWVSQIPTEYISDINLKTYGTLSEDNEEPLAFSSQILSAASSVMKRIFKSSEGDNAVLIFCDMSHYLVEKLKELLMFGKCDLEYDTVSEFKDLLGVLDIDPDKSDAVSTEDIKIEIEDNLKDEEMIFEKEIVPKKRLRNECVNYNENDMLDINEEETTEENNMHQQDMEPLENFDDEGDQEWTSDLKDVESKSSEDEYELEDELCEDKQPKKKSGSSRKRVTNNGNTSIIHLNVPCEHCSLVLSSKYKLKRHLERVHKIPFFCYACKKGFALQSELDGHSENCQPLEATEAMQCDICFMDMTSKQALKNHLGRVHKISFICHLCCKYFDTKSEMDIHYESCGAEHKTIYKCNICGHEERSKEDFKSHVEKLHPRTLYRCNICGQESDTKEDYKNHVKELHPKANGASLGNDENSQESQCPYCGKMYKCKKNLRFHIRATHEKAMNHVCSECGESFPVKSYLTTHIQRRHSNREPKIFICPTCGKNFKTRFDLNKHTKIVHINKIFQCKICEICFEFKREYKYHVSIVHEKATTYPCEYCPSIFLKGYERNKHIRFVHNNENRYFCKICNAGYKSTNKLDTHVKTVHGNGSNDDDNITVQKTVTNLNLQSAVVS